MTIGGGGGLIGVFALAAIQHSTFHCDIQHCDLRKPALQRRSRSLSLSLQPFFRLSPALPPPNSLLPPLLTPPSFYIQTWEIICYLPPPLSLVLFKFLFTSSSLYIYVFDRSPPMRHVSQHSIIFANISKYVTYVGKNWEYLTMSQSLHVSFRCILPFSIYICWEFCAKSMRVLVIDLKATFICVLTNSFPNSSLHSLRPCPHAQRDFSPEMTLCPGRGGSSLCPASLHTRLPTSSPF